MDYRRLQCVSYFIRRLVYADSLSLPVLQTTHTEIPKLTVETLGLLSVDSCCLYIATIATTLQERGAASLGNNV